MFALIAPSVATISFVALNWPRPNVTSMSRTRSFSVSPVGIVNALLTLRARRIN